LGEVREQAPGKEDQIHNRVLYFLQPRKKRKAEVRRRTKTLQ